MNIVFYIATVIAVAATVMVITRLNAIHALLYLIVSLLSVSVIFFVLGAPFVAALEVIIYAGAIMVLFVFAVMLLNLGPQTIEQESRWLKPGIWIGPGLLALILLGELIYILAVSPAEQLAGTVLVAPEFVGVALFGPYVIGVELAAILLLAGLVGAYHLGRREKDWEELQEAATRPVQAPDRFEPSATERAAGQADGDMWRERSRVTEHS